MLKRYDLMVPENFKYGLDIGVVLAAQIDFAIGEGIRHFDPETKEEVLTVTEVLSLIDKYDCMVVWSEDFGPNTGMSIAFKRDDGSVDFKSYILEGMHPKIKEILKGKKNNE